MTPEASPPEPPAERAALAGVTGRPLKRRRSWRWPAIALVLAAAAAGAAIWGWSMREERDALEDRVTQARRVIDGLSADLALRDSLAAAQPTAEELAPILAAPDLVDVPLPGLPPARGRLLGSDAGALLVTAGLSALPPERTYRLWRIDFTGAEPIAELGRAPRGFLLARFSDIVFLEGATEVGIAPGPADPDSVAAPPATFTLRGAVPR